MSDILTRTERIQMEEECLIIARLHPACKFPALDIISDLITDPNPDRRKYELRMNEIYKDCRRIEDA